MGKSTTGHIYKDKKSGIYQLEFTVNGKRKRESLKTKNRKEAEKRRSEILEPIYNLKTADDVIYHIGRAKQIYQPKFLPILSVWDMFEEKMPTGVTSEDAKNRNKKKWNKFVNWINFAYPEVQNISEITKEMASEFSKYLLNTGISHKVYNETLNLLNRVINALKEEGGVTSNFFDKSYLPRLQRDDISRKEFSEQETLKLLESIPEIDIPHVNEFEILFHIGTWAGVRLKDACLLKWESIDFSTNIIYLVPFKTKKHKTHVQIPIHPFLIEKLNKAYQWKVNEYVLPEIAEKYLKNNSNIGKYITKILKINGFENTEKQGRLSAPCLWGFHSLRYTFVSTCAKANIPLTLVQEIVGHRNPAMTKHYTRFDNSFRQEAIRKVALPIHSDNPDLKNKIINALDRADIDTLEKIYLLLQ